MNLYLHRLVQLTELSFAATFFVPYGRFLGLWWASSPALTSVRGQRKFPVLGHRRRQRKTLGLKDQMQRKRPTISTAQRVIAGSVSGNLQGQVQILNLHFQCFFF